MVFAGLYTKYLQLLINTAVLLNTMVFAGLNTKHL